MIYKVYLAGPISGMSFKESNSWRLEIAKKTPSWIQTISPLRAKDYLSQEKDLLLTYDNTLLSSAKAINQRDYSDVKRSDLVVVNTLNAKKASVGTIMEIAWCRAFEIPVLAIIDPDEKDNPHHHPMFTFPINYTAKTIDEACVKMTAILGTDDQLIEQV